MKRILSPRRDRYLAKFTIFLVIVALIAGIMGCGGGEEEEEKEFRIEDWYDLNAVRDNLEGDYVLMNDLDKNTDWYDEFVGDTVDGKGWQPIGIEGNPFKGTFDGGGNTISDLFIYRPEEDEVGLFGRVQEGLIENLGLMSVNVTGKKSVGALVGYSWKGTLDSDVRPPYGSKTYSHGIVTGQEDVGGLVGNNYGGTVNQCESSAEVFHLSTTPDERHWRAGGLVGLNSGPVLNCNYNGEVNGDRQVGGLVGHNALEPGGRVEDCGGAYSVNGTSVVGGVAGLNLGALRRNSYTGQVNGILTVIGDSLTALNEDDTGNTHFSDTALPGSYVGGVAGFSDGTVEDCSGDATVEGDQYVGGVAGANTGNVSRCSFGGSVTGKDYVGSLTGYNTGTLSNSNSTAYVQGTGIYVGNLVGWNEGVVSGCYWMGIVHSTYKLICDVPEVIVAGEETMIPLTVKTDELGELGYDGVQLHIKVYPRAGDVTIKVYPYPWVFTNEVYSEEFDLPADYNETIYPLVYFSQPGQYTFTFSVIEAPYGPVINNMTESITVSVVEP